MSFDAIKSTSVRNITLAHEVASMKQSINTNELHMTAKPNDVEARGTQMRVDDACSRGKCNASLVCMFVDSPCGTCHKHSKLFFFKHHRSQ